MPINLIEPTAETVIASAEVLKQSYLQVLEKSAFAFMLPKIRELDKGVEKYHLFVLLGEVADQYKKPAESVVFYTAALLISEEEKTKLYAKRAAAYFNLDEFQHALADYDKAYAEQSKTLTQALEIAYCLNYSNRHAEIPPLLLPLEAKLATKSNLESESFYWLLANVDFSSQKYSRKTIHYLQLAAKNSLTAPEQAQCFTKVGFVYEELELRLAAIGAYEQALKFSEEYAAQAALYQRIYLLALHERLFSKALFYGEFFKLGSGSYDNLLYLSAVLLRQGNRSAAKLFVCATVFTDPKVVAAYAWQAAAKDIYLEICEKTAQIKWIDFATSKAIFEYWIGKITQVEPAIAALSAKSKFNEQEYLKGIKLLDHRDYARAESVFQAINACGGMAHNELAEIYCAHADWIDAILTYTQAIEALTAIAATGRAFYFYQRSKIFSELKLFDCAADDLQLAIQTHDEIDPVSIAQLEQASITLQSKITAAASAHVDLTHSVKQTLLPLPFFKANALPNLTGRLATHCKNN